MKYLVYKNVFKNGERLFTKLAALVSTVHNMYPMFSMYYNKPGIREKASNVDTDTEFIFA